MIEGEEEEAEDEEVSLRISLMLSLYIKKTLRINAGLHHKVRLCDPSHDQNQSYLVTRRDTSCKNEEKL